jgi:DNA topoisomerase-2
MLGRWEWTSSKCLHIFEIPVGNWTTPYKDFLEKAMEGASGFKKEHISKVHSKYTDTTVSFLITLSPAFAAGLQKDETKLVKMFKLQKKIDTGNMHAFDAQNNMKKYATTDDILDEFYEQRLNLYTIRRQHMLVYLRKQLHKMAQKIKFLQLVVNGIFTFKGLNKGQLLVQLAQHGMDDADFLLTMSMWNMTDEKISEHCTQLEQLKLEIHILEQTSAGQLWIDDLKVIQKQLTHIDKVSETTRPLKKIKRKE